MPNIMNNDIIPVIMAGGSGTRLWPLSREMYPKQFISLPGHSESLFQKTLERANALTSNTPLIICNENHRFLAAEQLRQVNKLNKNIILESEGKNTAPAIALAAFHAQSFGNDPLLLVLAADHLIQDINSFRAAINNAEPTANQGKLVTFGVTPVNPETGYGYIQKGEVLNDNTHQVKRFVEKPDRATAQIYLDSGEYLWNSGIFLFKSSVYLNELKKFRPDIFKACQESYERIKSDMDFLRIDSSIFNTSPSESIDYAVMEKTTMAAVVSLNATWSDVGSFSSLWEISNKNDQENALFGEIIDYETENSFIYAESGVVAALGVKNLVIVQTKDAVLVADKNNVQNIKKIVEKLKYSEKIEAKFHSQVFRPWGHYESVDKGSRYQVKRITVNPGEKLSVQMHHHRAEHWIVVSGTALVTLNEIETLLTENQSIYLPIGAIHALENPGKIPLEMIEVQVGSYLGEDDIVRYSDKYGRL